MTIRAEINRINSTVGRMTPMASIRFGMLSSVKTISTMNRPKPGGLPVRSCAIAEASRRFTRRCDCLRGTSAFTGACLSQHDPTIRKGLKVNGQISVGHDHGGIGRVDPLTRTADTVLALDRVGGDCLAQSLAQYRPR